MATTFAPVSRSPYLQAPVSAGTAPMPDGTNPSAEAAASASAAAKQAQYEKSIAPVSLLGNSPVTPAPATPTQAQSPAPGPVSSGTSVYQGSKTLSDLTSTGGAMLGASMGGPIGEFAGAVTGKLAGDFITDLLGSADSRKQERAMREEIRRREAMQMRQRQEDNAATEFNRNLDLRARYGTAKNYAYNLKLQQAQNKVAMAQNFSNTLNNAAQARNQATDRMVQRGY